MEVLRRTAVSGSPTTEEKQLSFWTNVINFAIDWF